ncbi:hypothetical protein [Pandoraea sputorum]|uniref:Uncharacterized protein n=1 Tax=Pandoraea sputorum TaxID=93222 RepID=A0A5E5BKD9_9BURK|nr:hypothetical protein [Pandoraea sputorum]VVE85767.1 hypothetical protein PSP31121_05406 [Pandoraea sputorum]
MTFTVTRRCEPTKAMALELTLNQPIRLGQSSEVDVGKVMERRYCQPPLPTSGGTSQASGLIVLTVHAPSDAGVIDDPLPDPGPKLLEQVSAKIRKTFVAAGVPREIADAQADDIARYLACEPFLDVDKGPLGTQDGTQVVHEEAIDVSIRDRDVYVHKTTTYRAATGQPDGAQAVPTKVVDLGVKFSTSCSYLGLGDTWRVKATVANVQVQLSGAVELEALSELREQLGAPKAPHSWGEWLRQLVARLAALFGEQSIEFVVGDVVELTRSKAPTRPARIRLQDLPRFEAASFVFAGQGYWGWNNGVTEYRQDYLYEAVTRDGKAVAGPTTQDKAFDADGGRRGYQHARRFKETRELTFGKQIHAGTYAHGTEYLAQAARAKRALGLDPAQPALGEHLFRYAWEGHDFITLNDANLLAGSTLPKYAQQLRRLEQLTLNRRDARKELTPDELTESKRLQTEVDASAQALGFTGVPVSEQIALVKLLLNHVIIERIKEAFPNEDQQGQVLTTLGEGAPVTDIAIGGDGGPRFSNAPERLQISIHTNKLPPKFLDGAAYITFHSEHLSPGEDGTVQIGGTAFRAEELKTAKRTTTATWEITASTAEDVDQSGEATASEAKLWGAWYEAHLVLKMKTSPPPSLA